MTAVARYPDSTKTSLEQRLRARARERWPQIAGLQIRHRGNFSYVDATLADATTLKLCRLRYVGSARDWQFAIYRASHDDYDESAFFTGLPIVFYLDRGSGVPTYLQFVHQVDYALRLGFLREGDQLPQIKDVTRTLAVNPDTVMKAYRELELRGVAAGRPGVGTFIVQVPDIADLKQMAGLQKKLAGWVRRPPPGWTRSA